MIGEVGHLVGATVTWLTVAVALAAHGPVLFQEPCVPEVREAPDWWAGDRWRVSVDGVGVEFADDYGYVLEIAFREKRDAPGAEVLIHDARPVEVVCAGAQ